MTDITTLLFSRRDEGYAAFAAKLTPTLPADRFIGVRVPVLRALAKEYDNDPACADFLSSLPHTYYDENMFHALLLSRVRDYETCVRLVDRFLPHVDNWSVCDVLSPKIFARHKPELREKIAAWIASDHVYTCRFGIEMLMSHFLDGDFSEDLLALPAAVRSDEYYVNMMIAWFFATALAKQWDAAIPYLERRALPAWVHNKTITKARESYRITDEQKAYLKTLRV